MKFVFKAKNKLGEVREGTIDASTVEAAVEVLQKGGFFPMRITPESEVNPVTKAFLKYYDRVTEKEQVIFFRQLAILIEARVPVVAALTAINEQTPNKFFSRVIRDIVISIEDGLPFSDALEKQGDVFSPLSINIIRAGEASGNLKKSVEYVADNIEKNYKLVSQVRSAMMYPAIIMVVFFIIGFLVVSFILPKLAIMIREISADVPWYTQVVIGVGDFMAKFWWAVAVIIFGCVGGVIYYLRTNEGKKEWDEIKINLPIVGVIYRYVYISRFAENLAVLLVGGIPIIRALTIVSTVIGNGVYEKVILKTAEQVKIGGNMSDVLSKSPIFPPVVSHMIRIGEESGQVDAVLTHIAKFYDQETDMMTKNLSTLIEPVLMMIIGTAVGFMAFAVLMPIYNIAGQIK